MSHWEPMTALHPLVPDEPPARPGPAGPSYLESSPQPPGPDASYPAGRSRPTELAAASPADFVLRHGARSGRLIHVEYTPAREGQRAAWPGWAPAAVTDAFSRRGV